MTKVALDSIKPNDACFNLPPQGNLDKCDIEIAFHDSEKLETAYPSVHIQREKGDFVISHNNGAVTQDLAKDYFSPSILRDLQVPFNFIIAISKAGQDFSHYLKDGVPSAGLKPYGENINPLMLKIASFTVGGEINTPDTMQATTNVEITHELLSLPHAPRAWFNTLYDSFLSGDNAKKSPPSVLPRIRWVIDQLDSFEALIAPLKTQSSDSKEDPLDVGIKNNPDILKAQIAVVDYLFNGKGKPEEILASFDKFSGELYKRNNPPALKDIYDFLSQRLGEFSTKGSFTSNLPARQRLNTLKALCKSAVDEHRAELLSLDDNEALQTHLRYEIASAAERGVLANRVKEELQSYNLYPQWFSQNAAEIAAAITPHLKIQNGNNRTARVQVDAQAMVSDIEKMAKKHNIQTLEFNLGSLAVLRFLFGQELHAGSLDVWYHGKVTKLEIDLQNASSFQLLKEKLPRDIDKAKAFLNKNLPWIEVGVAGGGAAILGTGMALNGYHRSPLTTTGASVLGFGGSALLCNKVWKTRNNILSDLGCGAIGALAFGLTAQFALPKKPGVDLPSNFPGNSANMDGRNPTTGYGP